MYRLIIADDEDAARRRLAGDIPWESYGFRLCGEASGGEEALRLVEEARPHLLITDIRMDDMSGLSVLEQVRERFPATQVIILSAYSLFEYAQQALFLSAVGYLTKPVEKERLEPLLEKVRAAPQEGDPGVVRDVVAIACEYMRRHYAERITPEDVAAACFVHPAHLSRLFRVQQDTTFSAYLTELRLSRAAELLQMSELRVREIAERVGFDDYSYFCRVFRKNMGVTPLEYRCGAGGGGV